MNWYHAFLITKSTSTQWNTMADYKMKEPLIDTIWKSGKFKRILYFWVVSRFSSILVSSLQFWWFIHDAIFAHWIHEKRGFKYLILQFKRRRICALFAKCKRTFIERFRISKIRWTKSRIEKSNKKIKTISQFGDFASFFDNYSLWKARKDE